MNKTTTRLIVAMIAFLLVAVVAIPIVQGVINNQSNDISGAKDGKDGKDGEDGITPQLRINYTTNEWEYSYTQGVTWQSLGVKATGAAGKDGKDGQDGINGTDGQDGEDGKDGINGTNGKDGRDGVSPRIRINTSTSEWEISTDEGLTWETTGVKASGEVVASLTVDSKLSATSENPVQNKVITAIFNEYTQQLDDAFNAVYEAMDGIIGLPEVSTDDDGKGLIVQGGEWVVGELPKTPTQEKTIEITESGTYEITPDIGFALSKVLMNVNIPTGGGGGVSATEFLAETTFTNEYFAEFGAFGQFFYIDEATYNAWSANTEPVIVRYDGAEYVLEPQLIDPFETGIPGIGVGNLAAFGGTGNGEPFAIAAMFDVGPNGDMIYGFLCGSMVDTTPTQHTLRIYQDASGSAGGLVDGSGSGDEWVVAKGQITPTVNDPVTINHDLGVVPDIVYVVTSMAGSPPTGGEDKLHLISGCLISEKLLGSAAEELDDFFGYSFMCNALSGGVISGMSSVGLENIGNSSFSCVCNVTSETMRIGTNFVGLLPGNTYNWVAIARKTTG